MGGKKHATTYANILRILAEIYHEVYKNNKAYYLIAFDYSKAFDSITHNRMMNTLK